MTSVTGSSARPDVERAVARDDLQLDGEQEQRAAEGAVDGEGHGVGPAELAGAEQLERQHRVGAAVLDDEEGRARSRRRATRLATTAGLDQPRVGPSMSP